LQCFKKNKYNMQNILVNNLKMYTIKMLSIKAIKKQLR